MVNCQSILPTVCILWCADVERSNVIFSLYLLLVAVDRYCRHLSRGDDLVMSCTDYSLCLTLCRTTVASASLTIWYMVATSAFQHQLCTSTHHLGSLHRSATSPAHYLSIVQ